MGTLWVDKKTKRYLLIFSVLVFVFSGCLTTNETQPEIQNDLTNYTIGDQEPFSLYTSEEYTVKYPSNWSSGNIIIPYPINWSGEFMDAHGFRSPPENESDFRENILVTFVDLPEDSGNITLEDVSRSEEVEEARTLTGYVLIDSEKTTVGGIPAYKETYTYQYGTYTLKAQRIVLLKNNRKYVLGYTATVDSYERFHKMAEKTMYSLVIL